MFGALSTGEAWGCSLIFASYFVAIMTLTAAWGIPMMMQAYGMDLPTASSPLLIFNFMNIVGCLVFSYLSDRIKYILATLTIICIVRTILLLGLCPYIGSGLGLNAIDFLFGTLGLISGPVVPLIMRFLKDVYQPEYVATGVAINSTLAGIIGGFVQPIIGFALESTWTGLSNGNGKIYSPFGFDVLVGLLAIFSLLGIAGHALISLKLRPMNDVGF